MRRTKLQIAKRASHSQVTPVQKNAQVDHIWFKTRAKERGFTVRSLAAYLGYPNYGPVMRIFTGHRKLKLDEIRPFAEALGVSPVEILTHAGFDSDQAIPTLVSPSAETLRGDSKSHSAQSLSTEAPAREIAKIRVTGWVDAQGEVHAVDLGVVLGKVDAIPLGAEHEYEAVRLKTFGAGAVGTAMDGAIAVYRSELGSLEGLSGKMSIVELENGTRLAGVLNKSPVQGLWSIFGVDAGVKYSDLNVTKGSRIVTIRFENCD